MASALPFFYAWGETMESPVDVEELAELVRGRAVNLYEAHRLCCSEAVVLVMNQGFGGGLEPAAALRVASGFCGGMGAGCVCGGLGGAVIALGLFLGPGTEGWPGKRRFRELTRRLHDRFREVQGTVCCRELVQPFAGNRRARSKNCASLTGAGACLACSFILEARPELAASCDTAFLTGRDSRLSVIVGRLLGRKNPASPGRHG